MMVHGRTLSLRLDMDPTDRRRDDFPALLEEGRALRRKGDWRRAEALFEKAAERRPDRLEPLLERARLHWGRGDVEQAEELLRLSARRHPREPLPVVLLTRLLIQRDAADLAAEVIAEGCRRCPEHPLILLAEAELRLYQLDLSGAAACFAHAEAAGAGPGAVRAGLSRLALSEGNHLLAEGRCDAAAFCFKRAADLRPQAPEPLLQLAVALLRLDRPRRAAAQVRRLLELSAVSAGDAELLCRCALVLRDAGDGAAAVLLLERARRADPLHGGARRALADLVAARQPARALLLYAEEAASRPDDPVPWLLLAALCERLGDPRQAARCRRRARLGAPRRAP